MRASGVTQAWGLISWLGLLFLALLLALFFILIGIVVGRRRQATATA
jgi:hypothetical protein